MNFRVFATVPKTTPSGNKYDHTLYVGEFDPVAYDDARAKAYALSKVSQIYPNEQVTLSVEEVLPIVFHH